MKFSRLLPWLTFGFMLLSLYLIFMYAPTEATMGEVQRIFYFHVSLAWTSFLAIFIVFIYSIRVLASRERDLDIKAVSAAEVGAVFSTTVLISGPLWAKPVWGIWWTWDARLTSAFVLWLIYVGYLVLRRLVESAEQRARLSAVFGVLGAVDAPIVYMSNRWWRTQHPQPVIGGGEGAGLDPQMRLTLYVTFAACVLLFFCLWRVRCDLERTQEVVESLQRQPQFKGAS
ncbi:MAG: cytochrome c biogenesis protein [Acidobacteria bacterium]|nr:cytochrome c biogenesis protein [Acidobacteriota bacterium]MCI0623467.1 cytochrome c biogenesis protein [Acidobacteriota bacterium]MCI0723987.1 cytochrome c biogenesis protein [Acidobacteriota bacterium]